MEAREIVDLLNLICAKEFSEFELEHEGLRIRVERAGPTARHRDPGAAETRAVEHVMTTAESASLVASAADDLLVVKAPMVGTFFRSPSPSTDAFVKVGDRVKKGQVLCIIEAMKLMNEIESEHSGVVAEVVVENGQPVEYGEALFRLRSEK